MGPVVVSWLAVATAWAAPEHGGPSVGVPLPDCALLDLGSRLSRQLPIRRVPTVVLADRRRRIRYVHEGYPGNPEILRAVRAAASEAE